MPYDADNPDATALPGLPGLLQRLGGRLGRFGPQRSDARELPGIPILYGPRTPPTFGGRDTFPVYGGLRESGASAGNLDDGLASTGPDVTTTANDIYGGSVYRRGITPMRRAGGGSIAPVSFTPGATAQPGQTAAQRLAAMNAAGEPPVKPLHGFKRFADVLGQIVGAVNPNVEAFRERLRYGPQLSWEQQHQQLESEAAREGKAGLTAAQTSEATAKAAQATAEAKKLGLPTTPKTPGLEQQYLDAEGELAQATTPEAKAAAQAKLGRIEQAANLTKSGEKPPRPTDEQSFISDYLAGHNLPDNPGSRLKARAAYKALGRQPREPNQYADWKAEHPGGTVEQYISATSGARLGAQEKSARDTASVALQSIPDVQQQMSELKDKLGPVGGRAMEIGAKIGSTDPTYISVRENTDLIVSALSKVHFGARGSWEWLQDFKKNVDAGTLTYPDLEAGLQVAQKWLERYAQLGEDVPASEKPPKLPSVRGAAPKQGALRNPYE